MKRMVDKAINFANNFLYLIRAFQSLNPSKRFIYKKRECGTINILGNGPSLKNDIDILLAYHSNEKYFALNDFGTTDLFLKFKPNFYVICDPCYWMKKEECNERDYNYRILLFERLNKETSWNLTLFIPWVAYKSGIITSAINNKNIRIRPFNYLNYYPTYSNYYRKILEKNLGVVPVGNVLGCAIYISINYGFEKICLYGADHSWTKDIRVNESNQVCTIKRHFFEDKDILEPWHKSNKEVFRMSEILNSLQKHFLGYEYLNWYAKVKGTSVFNCSKDSFIDAFERVNNDKNKES